MANFVFIFVACALLVVVASEADKSELIRSKERSPVLPEKEIEDFSDFVYVRDVNASVSIPESASKDQRNLSNGRSSVQSAKDIEDDQDGKDSEYIPVGDEERINTNDDFNNESSIKISSSSLALTTPIDDVSASVNNSETEFTNSIVGEPSEKMFSSLDDSNISTKISNDKFTLTPLEKHSNTEDLSILEKTSTLTSTDTSTITNDISSTSKALTGISNNISALYASTRSDDASSSTDVSNDKSDSSSVSGISISPTSNLEISRPVTSLLSTNSDSTLDNVSKFSTTPTVSTITSSDATPAISKVSSIIPSSDATPAVSKASTIISSSDATQSTASTEELVSNTDITSEATSTDIETTVSSDEPYIDKSTIVEETSSYSSAFTTPTSTSSEVTTDHLQHIIMPGLKKVKLGLAITFLAVAVIAMAAILVLMIKMRKKTIDYEELRLEP